MALPSSIPLPLAAVSPPHPASVGRIPSTSTFLEWLELAWASTVDGNAAKWTSRCTALVDHSSPENRCLLPLTVAQRAILWENVVALYHVSLKLLGLLHTTFWLSLTRHYLSGLVSNFSVLGFNHLSKYFILNNLKERALIRPGVGSHGFNLYLCHKVMCGPGQGIYLLWA